MFLSGTDRIVRAKKGEAGLHVMKTGMVSDLPIIMI